MPSFKHGSIPDGQEKRKTEIQQQPIGVPPFISANSCCGIWGYCSDSSPGANSTCYGEGRVPCRGSWRNWNGHCQSSGTPWARGLLCLVLLNHQKAFLDYSLKRSNFFCLALSACVFCIFCVLFCFCALQYWFLAYCCVLLKRPLRDRLKRLLRDYKKGL